MCTCIHLFNRAVLVISALLIPFELVWLVEHQCYWLLNSSSELDHRTAIRQTKLFACWQSIETSTVPPCRPPDSFTAVPVWWENIELTCLLDVPSLSVFAKYSHLFWIYSSSDQAYVSRFGNEGVPPFLKDCFPSRGVWCYCLVKNDLRVLLCTLAELKPFCLGCTVVLRILAVRDPSWDLIPSYLVGPLLSFFSGDWLGSLEFGKRLIPYRWGTAKHRTLQKNWWNDVSVPWWSFCVP